MSRLNMHLVGTAAPPLPAPTCTNTGAWRCWWQWGKHCRNTHSSPTNPTEPWLEAPATPKQEKQNDFLILIFQEPLFTGTGGCQALALHIREGLAWTSAIRTGKSAVGAPIPLMAPRTMWWSSKAWALHSEPLCQGCRDSLHQRHWKSSAKPWPQEILISRNKSLFYLKGWSFPMV